MIPSFDCEHIGKIKNFMTNGWMESCTFHNLKGPCRVDCSSQMHPFVFDLFLVDDKPTLSEAPKPRLPLAAVEVIKHDAPPKHKHL